MKYACFLVSALIASIAIAAEPEAQPPDLSKYDAATLRVVASQLYVKIAELEAEIADLKAQLGQANGGTIAHVDGDTTTVPDGSWTVKILANVPADTSTLEREIETQRQQAADLIPRLEDARVTLREMDGAEEKYINEDGDRKSRDRYTARELIAPRRTVQKLEGQQRGIEGRIRQLQQEIRQASTERRIAAVTTEGVPCELIARGVYFAIGASLGEQQTYTVTGRGHFTPTNGTIYIKTAKPAEDTEPATASAPAP